MPHYGRYESTFTKKHSDKKNKAKEKSLSSKLEKIEDFIIEEANDYGVVIEVKYNEAVVLYHDKIINAVIRKDLNIVCNQVLFPGDKVVIESKNGMNVITHLLKRTSLLSRTKKDSTRLSDSVGITKNIAANIDLVVIVVSSTEPPLHPKFIDRYLLITQNNNIPTIICLNKADLKTKEEDRILDIYRSIGIPIVETSTYNNIGIETLKSYLRNKQAIFVGHSGVGKSSLTNAIMEDTNIKTGSVSEKSKKGRHTTTSSRYYVWDDNSSIIDTPGIRSLDVSSFDPMEVQDYFSEFENFKDKCKYKDCLHFNEPLEDCFIKQAVESKSIDSNRYGSYRRIVSDLMNEKKLIL
jgi:ribosome biogenesis GTPase